MNDMSDRDNGIGESSRVAPRLPRAVAGAQASVRPRTIDRRDVAGEGRIRVIAKAVRAVDSTICAADHAMWAAEKAIAVTKSCTFPADDPYAQGFFIEQAPPPRWLDPSRGLTRGNAPRRRSGALDARRLVLVGSAVAVFMVPDFPTAWTAGDHLATLTAFVSQLVERRPAAPEPAQALQQSEPSDVPRVVASLHPIDIDMASPDIAPRSIEEPVAAPAAVPPRPTAQPVAAVRTVPPRPTEQPVTAFAPVPPHPAELPVTAFAPVPPRATEPPVAAVPPRATQRPVAAVAALPPRPAEQPVAAPAAAPPRATAALAVETPPVISPSAEKARANPAVGEPAAKPAPTYDREMIAMFLKRGEDFVAVGEIAAARLLLKRAAEAGEPRAALALAATYDPIMLEKLGVRGVAPDKALARAWYEKAAAFGSLEASRRLELLASR